jgi:glycosyltransferase involved in cell wall biosynthesis
MIATATSLWARVQAQKRLLVKLTEEHQRRPYDLIYQFSQFEVPWLRGRERLLPPVVIHPEVHMAGELRWHRREHALAIRCGGKTKTGATTALLASRTLVQRAAAARVAAVIAPSRVFAEHLRADYGIARDRLHVVPNPIDLDRFSPGVTASEHRGPLELLYVSRLSMRKGLEMVVALSHRLAGDPGHFRIRVVGGHSMFSDYRPLLDDLHPVVGVYEGHRDALAVAELQRSADCLIQPSHYEPFALTVGEALASGTPVVVSDQVGAGEQVDSRCCTRFPAGDLGAFEAAVRAASSAVAGADRASVRQLARSEAERLFAPDRVCAGLVEAFSRVLSQDASRV